MKKQMIYLVAMLFLVVSCTRKSLPDPVEDVSEFSVKYTIDGVDIEIAAGENGYVLEPGHRRNAGGVVEYVAEFRKSNGDPTALEVVILDDAWSLPIDPVNPDEALTVGALDFQSEAVDLDSLNLIFCTFLDPAEYELEWIINGNAVSGNIPDVTFDEGETLLDARLTATRLADGCADSLIQVCEQFDAEHNYADYYYLPFEAETTGVTNQLRMAYTGNEENTAGISWEVIDNGAVFTEEGGVMFHTFETAGPHLVSMTVTADNGHQFIYRERVLANPNSGACAANIHYLSPPQGMAETSRVRIQYTSPEGQHYSSYVPGITDPGSGSFEILSVQDLDLLQGTGSADARRLEVAFGCVLYNVDNPSDQIEIEGFEGVIAVTFPQ